MRWLLRHLIAGIELGRLALALRFRTRGAYMRWRLETAFGNDESAMPSKAARRRAIVEYANWCAAMRRLSRSRA